MSTPGPREGEPAHTLNLRLSLYRSLYLDAAAADHGLNRTDLDCLLMLILDGPMTAGALAEGMGLTTGGISGILDRLERIVYVARETDPDDRRRTVVRVTPAGALEIEPHLEPFRAEAERLASGSVSLAGELTDWAAALQGIRSGRFELVGPLTLPLDGVEAGALEIAGGGSDVEIVPAMIDDLVRVDVPGSGARLLLRGGSVRVSPPRSGTQPGRIELNASIPWSVRLHGGSNRVTGDFTGLRLTALDMYGGANTSELLLGEPNGSVPVRISGGANTISLRRPAGCGASVRLQGTAVLDLDGDALGSVSHTTWERPGNGSDRYAVTIRGGANTLTLE